MTTEARCGRRTAGGSRFRATGPPSPTPTTTPTSSSSRPGAAAAPRALTTWEGSDSSPAFTPDGTSVVYLENGDPKDIWYATNSLAVVPVAGGMRRILTPGLDRNLSNPRPAPDGTSVLFLLEEAGTTHLARVPLAGGRIGRVVSGERDVDAFDVGPAGPIVVLETTVHQPPEIAAVDGAGLKRLTRVNDELLSGIRLAPVERFKAKSADGTAIDAFLTRPPDAPSGRRLPTLLRIHGGPVAQYSTRFSFEWQLFAARGYAVVSANPRGSSGYGAAFSRAIWADWGNKDFQDVMAAVDEASARASPIPIGSASAAGATGAS